MKSPITKAILIIAVCLVLFYCGVIFYEQFIEWTLPNMDGLKFQVATLGGNFKDMLLFSLSITLIPVSALFTWRFAPIFETKRKISNIAILTTSIFLCALLRQKWLMYQANIYFKNSQESFGHRLDYNMPIESFNVTNYMLLGLLLGTIISYYFLKQKIKTNQ